MAVAVKRSSPMQDILGPERRLGPIERRGVAVALPAGQLKRHALKPDSRLLSVTPAHDCWHEPVADKTIRDL